MNATRGDTTSRPRSRNVKLTDAEWEALNRIAIAHGFEWGGIPSRSDALRLLVRQEIERMETGKTAGNPSNPGEFDRISP